MSDICNDGCSCLQERDIMESMSVNVLGPMVLTSVLLKRFDHLLSSSSIIDCGITVVNVSSLAA